MSLQTSNSPAGPWQDAEPEAVAAELERRRAVGHTSEDAAGFPDEADCDGYADRVNGVILFVRKGDRTFAVSDVSAFHGGDAATKYDIAGVDDEGFGNDDEDAGGFDDPLPILQDL